MKFRNVEMAALYRTIGLLALAIVGIASRSMAETITVVPTGLAPGSQYRLVLWTAGTYTATDGNIADYNTAVNAEANLVPALGALDTTWRIIASTSTVNAIDNIGQDPGVPVYNLEDQLVADDGTHNAGGLFNRRLINPVGYNESGATFGSAGRTVWSGSTDAGVAVEGRALGALSPSSVVVGDDSASDLWLEAGTCPDSPVPDGCGAIPVFAISGAITVPGNNAPDTPEPSTLALLATGIILLFCKRGIAATANRHRVRGIIEPGIKSGAYKVRISL